MNTLYTKGDSKKGVCLQFWTIIIIESLDTLFESVFMLETHLGFEGDQYKVLGFLGASKKGFPLFFIPQKESRQRERDQEKEGPFFCLQTLLYLK